MKQPIKHSNQLEDIARDAAEKKSVLRREALLEIVRTAIHQAAIPTLNVGNCDTLAQEIVNEIFRSNWKP